MNSDSPAPASDLRGETHKSGATLTDAEVICEFMEPRPHLQPVIGGVCPYAESPGKWWTYRFNQDRQPRRLTLDALWEVEERLTQKQWLTYERHMLPIAMRDPKVLLHATAEQKIRALAATLRIGATPAKDETREGLPGDGR